MKQKEFIAALKSGKIVEKGLCAYRFEQDRKWENRDCILVYLDGRIRFERYCYGEAAGLVFGVWVKELSLDGSLVYEPTQDLAVKPEALPKQIHWKEGVHFTTDDKPYTWIIKAKLKVDDKNGYTRGKTLLKRLFRG